MTRPLALSLLLAVVAGCSAQPAGNATPQYQEGGGYLDIRSIQTGRVIAQPAVASAASEQPMTLVQAPLPTMPAEPAGNGLGVRSGGSRFHAGAPPLAAVIYSGRLAWASPSHGPRYLALREPVGTRVEICGPSACLEMTSNDYGPVLSLWKQGRIADVAAAAWERVCGVPLRFGLCPGSIRVISRPQIALPATDQEEP